MCFGLNTKYKPFCNFTKSLYGEKYKGHMNQHKNSYASMYLHSLTEQRL